MGGGDRGPAADAPVRPDRGLLRHVARELSSDGRRRSRQRESIVIVPTSTVNLLTERALSAALSLGETVVAVAVAGDEEERAADPARLGRVELRRRRSRC